MQPGKVFLTIAALLCIGLSATAAERADPQIQILKNKAFASLCEPNPCDEGPKNSLVVIPQYFHAKHDSMTFRIDGTKNAIKAAKGTSNGVGVTMLLNHKFSDFFGMSLFYEFVHMDYTGGAVVPNLPIAGGREKQDVNSHAVGLFGDLNFNAWGKLNLSLIQAFDSYHGGEVWTFTSAPPIYRDTNDFQVRVTSLMAWYEKDFEPAPFFKITPYAGWRTLYAHVEDQNVWGTIADKTKDNDWIHLASGGVKLGYQCGKVGLGVRGGFNYRVTRTAGPGFASRAVAPGVTHFAFRNNADRIIGTFGTNITYPVTERFIVGLGYDGYVGKDTNAHMGTLTGVLVF